MSCQEGDQGGAITEMTNLPGLLFQPKDPGAPRFLWELLACLCLLPGTGPLLPSWREGRGKDIEGVRPDMCLTGEAGASDSLSLCCLLPRLREGRLEQVVGGVPLTHTLPMCSYFARGKILRAPGRKVKAQELKGSGLSSGLSPGVPTGEHCPVSSLFKESF